MIIKSQDVNHITNFDYVKAINVKEVPVADGYMYGVTALMKTDSKAEAKSVTIANYRSAETATTEMKRLYQAFKDNAPFFEFRSDFSVRVANADSEAEDKITRLVREIIMNPSMLSKIINDYGETDDDGDTDD